MKQKNPLRSIYDFFKHFFYCPNWQICPYFQQDQPRCTKNVGIGCSKNHT